MAIRAVVDTSNLRVSAEHSELRASTAYENAQAQVSTTSLQADAGYVAPFALTAYVAASMQEMVLEYEPKNQKFSDAYTLSDLTVVVTTKVFNESIQTGDVSYKVLGKSHTEIVTADDAPYWAFSKFPYDSVTTLDINDKDFTKQVADQAALVDLPSLNISLDKHSDITGITDYFTKSTTFNRAFNDAFTLDDYASVDKDFIGTKGNVLGVSDSQAFEYSKPLIDTLGQSDYNNVTTGLNKTDSLSFTDTAIRNSTKGLEDTASVSDIHAWTVDQHKEDAFSPEDSTSLDVDKPQVDSLNFVDNFSRQVSFDRQPTETVSLNENVGKNVDTSKTDQISAADTFARLVTFNRFFTDSFVLDDMASVDKNIVGNKTNVFGFADIHSCEVTKELTDSFGFLETVSITRRSAAGFNTDSFNTALFN